MSFEEVLEKSKKKWDEFAKGILTELEQAYDTFWHDLIEDLNRKKLGLEQEVEKLEKKKIEVNEEIEKLSTEIVKLAEGVKTETERIKKYEIRQNEMLGKIMEIEQRETENKKRGEELKKKEEELLTKEEELRIEATLINERQRSLKKIWEKAHQSGG